MARNEKIKFIDNSAKVEAQINSAVISFLKEAGGEIQSQAARNSRVDTGQLKSSWDYRVNLSTNEVTIGSTLENALYEEFGTGEYAVKGNGRKTPWKYKDREGKWHYTKGKRPNRTLGRAFDKTKPLIKKRIETILKGLK